MKQLNYATATRYHHRRRGRLQGIGQLIVMTLVIGGSAVFFRYSPVRPDDSFIGVWFGICGIVGAVGVLHSLQLIYQNRVFECRVEDGKLYLQYDDQSPQMYDLAEVTAFSAVTTERSDNPEYHLRFRDGQDILVEQRVIGYVGRFSRAIKAENPAIRITYEP